jgi:DNA-binding SARP family transcriptional activator
MPSPADSVLSAAILWLALVLIVPKRSWGAVRARLRAAASGQRRHVFGPPSLPRTDLSSRFLTALVSEAPRCLELGVPLCVTVLAAEHAGAERRKLAEARWVGSPTGWIWAHLRGRIGTEELSGLLSEGGYAPPATKAELRFRLAYAMPPMSWLRDLDEDQPPPSLGSAAAADGQPRPEMSLATADRLMVQTLGTLRVSLDDNDLTAELHTRPTVSFLVQYLLLRAMHEPGQPVPRTAAADELYPGVERERQLERLRKRLHHLQSNLPEFSRALRVTERDLLLDLDACRVDAVEILRLAAAGTARSSGLLPEAAVGELEDAVAASAAEFLPDWDDLQQSINGGRGAAEEYVRSLRVRLQDARVTLLIRLGSHHLARREAGRAVVILDEALRLDPARQGLAEELAQALEAAGHRARAAEIRRRYVREQ